MLTKWICLRSNRPHFLRRLSSITRAPCRDVGAMSSSHRRTGDAEGVGARGLGKAVAHIVLLVVVPPAATTRLDVPFAVKSEHVVRL